MSGETRKRKLSENRAAAIALLVAAILIAVPLLGGLRLVLADRAIQKQFDRTVLAYDKSGSSILTATNGIITSAERMLSTGKELSESSSESVQANAGALKKAIDRCNKADKSPAQRYFAYLDIMTAARQYVSRFNSGELNALMDELNSQSLGVERIYRYAVSEMNEKRSDLYSDLPSRLLAKLFGLRAA